MHYTVSQPLGSHQNKRWSAEKPFTVLFLSLKSFFSLGYTSRKLSDQEERQEDCFWLPCNTQKTVTRTVDKINYFLPWSGKAETSEVSWPIMAAAPGLALPSPHCIQSIKAPQAATPTRQVLSLHIPEMAVWLHLCCGLGTRSQPTNTP